MKVKNGPKKSAKPDTVVMAGNVAHPIPAPAGEVVDYATQEKWSRDYASLMQAISHRSSMLAHGAGHVIVELERTPDLYAVFLQHLPNTLRQQHRCRACQEFVNRHGHLAVVAPNGSITSLIWPEGLSRGNVYGKSLQACRREALRHKIVAQFFVDRGGPYTLGEPETGPWKHLHARLSGDNPLIRSAIVDNGAAQRRAASIEEWGMVDRALRDYSVGVMERALTLMADPRMNGVDKFKAPLNWLLSLARNYSIMASGKNVIWQANAMVPVGFKHIRGSALAVLLDGMKLNVSVEKLIDTWNRTVDGVNYQRPKAPPKEGNVVAAAKAFKDAGLEPALARRFALVQEVETLWHAVPAPSGGERYGAFAGVIGAAAGKKRPGSSQISQRARTMSWTKFERDLLSVAARLSTVARPRANYMGFMTAVNANAQCLFKYGHHVSSYAYDKPSSAARWNLEPGLQTNITAICRMPWQWQRCSPKMEELGRGILLALEGCVDKNLSTQVLFPVLMRGDLHPYRATIEAYSNSTTPEYPDPQVTTYACGLQIANLNEIPIDLRVTMPDGSWLDVTIDRFE